MRCKNRKKRMELSGGKFKERLQILNQFVNLSFTILIAFVTPKRWSIFVPTNNLMRFLFTITTFTAVQFESTRICELARMGPMDKERLQVHKPNLKSGCLLL
jgi:hypothetical protein